MYEADPLDPGVIRRTVVLQGNLVTITGPGGWDGTSQRETTRVLKPGEEIILRQVEKDGRSHTITIVGDEPKATLEY